MLIMFQALFSIFKESAYCCMLTSLLATKRFEIKHIHEQAVGEGLHNTHVLRNILEHWRLPEKRKQFVELMEKRVSKNK